MLEPLFRTTVYGLTYEITALLQINLTSWKMLCMQS